MARAAREVKASPGSLTARLARGDAGPTRGQFLSIAPVVGAKPSSTRGPALVEPSMETRGYAPHRFGINLIAIRPHTVTIPETAW